jgi:multidrug resistance protein, MATE family
MNTQTQAPSMRALFVLAWPIIISRSTQSVVGFTDAAMSAQLGESALAAVTSGAVNMFTFLILPMGISFIISTFVSQHKGAGDLSAARRFGLYGLILALLTEVVCLLLLPLISPLVGLMPYTPEVQALMIGYLWYRLPSGGFAIGLEVFGNYYGGLGNTRLPMMAQIAAMVLNVFFNWVLIYGNLGFPALGVEGAAIASSLAALLAFLLILTCFLLGVGDEGKASPLQKSELLKMFQYGLPSGFNWFIEFASFSFFINFVLASLGTTTVAALMAGMQINGLSFMPAFALASAGAIICGQQIGAGQKDFVPKTARLTLMASISLQGLVGISYLLFPRFFLSPFIGKEDPQLFLQIGIEVLSISAAWQIFDALVATYAEALRAAGDTAFTFYARAFFAWAVFAPGAWLTVRVFGFQHVAALSWIVLYLALLGGVLYWRFRSGRWREFELTEGAEK